MLVWPDNGDGNARETALSGQVEQVVSSADRRSAAFRVAIPPSHLVPGTLGLPLGGASYPQPGPFNDRDRAGEILQIVLSHESLHRSDDCHYRLVRKA